LINEKRNGQFRNIFETKYFFISSDQGLRRWDFKRKDSTPAVLLPSQWMSILLRYVTRTNDDFKSFVSFLNLSQNETSINSEKLQLILLGIGEITSDVERQSLIVETMVQNKFQGIIEKNSSEEEIIENARNFAKTQLDNDLDAIIRDKEALQMSLETHKEGAKAAIYEEQEKKALEISKAKSLELQNRKLINTLVKKYVDKYLFIWRIPAFLSLILSVVIVLFYLGLFCYKTISWNFAVQIATWINSLPSDSIENDIAKAIYVFPGGTLIYLVVLSYNRLLNMKKIHEKRLVLEELANSKYNKIN